MNVIKILKKDILNVKHRGDGTIIIHLKELKDNGLNKCWIVDGNFGMQDEGQFIFVKLAGEHAKN